jgi:hypothetical protein
MVVKREKYRRHYKPVTQFPLSSKKDGMVLYERSRLPTRRLNHIEVKELSCLDFIAGLS